MFVCSLVVVVILGVRVTHGIRVYGQVGKRVTARLMCEDGGGTTLSRRLKTLDRWERRSMLDEELARLADEASTAQVLAEGLESRAGLVKSVSSTPLPTLDSAEFDALMESLRRRVSLQFSRTQQPESTSETDNQLWLLKPALTENGAVTLESAGSGRLDFFFKVLQGSSDYLIRSLLSQAWNENALDTLQLIAHLCDVRGGKSERQCTYQAVSWLLENHPLTCVENLSNLVKVGCWKDILAITETMMIGSIRVSDKMISHRSPLQIKKIKNQLLEERQTALAQLETTEEKEAYLADRRMRQTLKLRVNRFKAMFVRRTNRIAKLEASKSKYRDDPVYALVHMATAHLFARELQKDMKRLSEFKGKSFKSMSAKWAPSPNLRFDKMTLIGATIAELLFPATEHMRDGEARYAYINRVQTKYQREILAPLRRASNITEVLMSAGEWDKIDLSRVGSVNMKTNANLFIKHNEAGFSEFLNDVAAGKTTIAAEALKPHEIVQKVNSGISGLELQAAELQWKSYVDKLRSKGSFKNALAVCDVSGSMIGLPMEAAVSLSLLLSELASPPFQNIVCTFSNTPVLHQVKGSSLKDRYSSVSQMDWQMNTNIDAVFDLILKRAKAARLPPSEMLSTIFIFSDMEFDGCAEGSVSNFDRAKAEFAKAGYKLPSIVFWNMRGNDRTHGRGASVPAPGFEKYVALVSGYSGQMLSCFMDGKLEEYNPMEVMMSMLKSGKYDDWVVVD